MPRAQPLDPDARRTQLLLAARHVFARSGYHNASVSDIVTAAGVARGTFYNYFDSKRAIFQAVLDDLMECVQDAVVPIDVQGDIPEQVRLNLQRLVDALTDPEVARLLLAEAIGIDDEGDHALRDFYRQACDRVVRALRTGQELGIVRSGDTELIAQMLIGVLKQPILQATLEGRPLDHGTFVTAFYGLLVGGVLR